MDLVLLILRLAIAGVFIIAGTGKLLDINGSRRAVHGFGVPERLARTLGLLLPVAELMIAMALIPSTTAWWGAVGATGLLVLFVAGMIVNLARGRTPGCHCFGQLHSSPLGWPTLARTGAFTLAASFVVWNGRNGFGMSPIGWLESFSTPERWLLGIALSAVIGVAVLAWLLLNLLQQQGRILLRLDETEARLSASYPSPAPAAHRPTVQAVRGLPIGSEAPRFRIPASDGTAVSLDDLLELGKPTILVFSETDCSACAALLPKIAGWQREHPKLTIVVVYSGSIDAAQARAHEHELGHVLFENSRHVAQSFQAAKSPAALLIRASGEIGSHLALGPDAIHVLVNEVLVEMRTGVPGAAEARPRQHNGHRLADGPGHEGLPVGTPAPGLQFADTDGRLVDLSDFRGKPVVVLFWDPQCGFCKRMLPELHAWEAQANDTPPHLLIVSTGDHEANRALGLHTPVLHAESRAVGQRFGAHGTPSAVLVDADGRIASPIATGAPSIWNLIHRNAGIPETAP